MKGVILAGGLGTRLFPLTKATNKHLLPVYDRCMVHYAIDNLLRAGLDQILVVTGGPHAGDFIRVLGNGKELGINHLEYGYQEGEGGIADALDVAADFAEGEPIMVVLGDNFTDADLGPAARDFKEGAHLFLKEVPDPRDCGVAVFDENDPSRIVAIEEKPEEPKSNYAVTGFYIYDSRAFEYINRSEPSARGELEITTVNNFYLHDGLMTWSELDGLWLDCGSFDSLFEANRVVAEARRRGQDRFRPRVPGSNSAAEGRATK
ncbi:MAG TPA: sugar phosphate nucleotidyltransferase [Armatimonadota bacterium]|nr:sugar phosphate nucleotidyltransferase [Armatimonadota bacterium]